MRATLDELLAALDELAAFIKSIEPVNHALESHVDGVVRRYLTTRRRLDYAAFVVVLYAAFERFVEDLVWSHVELQSSQARYEDLPAKLRNKHMRESGRMLARLTLGEGRYAGLNRADLVGNLYRCTSGEMPYALNRQAVVHHELNLRAGVVGELFTSVGVENINARVRNADSLVQWHRRANDRAASDVPGIVIDLRLEDLVGRRNHVAHRGGDPGESLDAAEMQARIDFVAAYCRSLYGALAEQHLRAYVDREGTAEPLTLEEEPYNRGLVVVVAKPARRIRVDQLIVGAREGQPLRWGRVQEIQVNDSVVPCVEADSPAATLGLRLDFKVTKQTALLLLHDAEAFGWL